MNLPGLLGRVEGGRDVTAPQTVKDERPDGFTLDEAVLQASGAGNLTSRHEAAHQGKRAGDAAQFGRAQIAVHRLADV